MSGALRVEADPHLSSPFQGEEP